ncbi:MAG: hypothetical protein ACR2RF_12415 [Geminicoccaceae bacterium]
MPAPSSTTVCPGSQATALVTARANAMDEGMIDPIDFGDRNH